MYITEWHGKRDMERTKYRKEGKNVCVCVCVCSKYMKRERRSLLDGGTVLRVQCNVARLLASYRSCSFLRFYSTFPFLFLSPSLCISLSISLGRSEIVECYKRPRATNRRGTVEQSERLQRLRVAPV